MAQRTDAPTPEHEGLVVSNQTLLNALGIRAKLTVSQPGDPDEQEADRLAEAFMSGRGDRPQGNQEMLRALGVRAKPRVSQPSDPEESEADRLAEEFGRSLPVLRKCTSCAEDEAIMRQASGSRTAAAPPTSVRGGGHALTPAVRAPFERFYRADLSHVRVHTDVEARQSATRLYARAYAHGADVVFADGEYAPHTDDGMKLLAHEIAHVVHHGRRPGQGSIWRQVLSPDEMLGIITRERAFTYSPGAGAVCEDPQGVGRSVGAAAGGRRAGHGVFAVIQITDADGRPVALSYGEHLSYGDPHAEQRAVRGLNRTIPQVRDVSGGRMTVVVDQIPCPPGRANCMGTLQDFARRRGLTLEVHVPTRERMGGGGSVAPRTAAMSSMRTDVPPVSLTRYQPGGGTTPPTGTGGGNPPPTAVRPRGSGPIRFVAPRPVPPSVVRAQASAIGALNRQTQRSIRISGRISLGIRGVGGLLSVLGMIHTVRTAQQMAAHGTIFADAEAQADGVITYGSEMETWAVETTNDISLLEILAAITGADEREDSTALFDIDGALTDTYLRFYERADEFREMGQNLRARERALGIMSDFYKRLVSVPQGISTAPNYDAFAMHVSLERLQGRVGSAANHLEAADRQMRFYAERLEAFASAANDKAWDLVFTRVVVAVAEAERERELDETIRRERRLNEIHEEIEAIDAELQQPVCRPPEETEPLLQRREALLGERALLQTAPSP